MQDTQLTQISNFIWGVADDYLRDLYVRGKYRDVILPMTVLRRLDAVLEPTKQKVLDEKKWADDAGIDDQAPILEDAAGQSFYNTSQFGLKDLTSRASQQQLRDDFNAYLDGFSPNVQDILDKFEFRNQLGRLSTGDVLGDVVARFLSPQINLSPEPVLNPDGSVRLPGLDNHAMGTIFEDLVRRFNEENNEEAGEHWTPRDAVELVAQLVFQPIRDRIESGTYLLYDGAIGTGGMLTIAEQTLQGVAEENGKRVSTHLYGQEVNNETYAICKADMLLKGEQNIDKNILGGPQHSTLSSDAFSSQTFDFMLSNPPLREELEQRPGQNGREKGPQGPAFPDQPRRQRRVLAGDPDQRRPDALPGQHGQQDEARFTPGKQDSRGPQREFPLHRRCRPGREQHPALDHRERLAGGHRGPAAQHVLQHGHRHLHLGPDQPEAGAPEGKGPAHRRHEVVHPAPKEPGPEELRTLPGEHPADCGRLHGLRGDRGVEDLPQRGLRVLEGDGGTAAEAGRGVIARAALKFPRRLPRRQGGAI